MGLGFMHSFCINSVCGFATHAVSLRGHSLGRIESAMQRMELSLLTALPGKQRSLVPDGQPVVLEIEVAEAKDKN